MQKKPKISVIVPVYKVEDHLERCAQSILDQTLTDFELILVDDRSPDNSGKICDGLAKKDPRIKVLHLSENIGLSGARNAGIEIALGEYISFIDSDDWVDGNFLEALYATAQLNNCDIVACQVIITHNPTPTHEAKTNKLSGARYFNREESLINIFTSNKEIRHVSWNKLYKTSLFRSGVRFPIGILHEDVLTTYRLVNISNRVGFTLSTNYYYYQRESSITRGQFNPKRLEVLNKTDELKRVLGNPSGELSKAIEYFEVSLAITLINDMISARCSGEPLRRTIASLSTKSASCMSNHYLSIREKALLLILLKLPYIYRFMRSLKSFIVNN